eukprot:SAG31_NODE_30937_length_374_cov_0.938182_1_plen_35_part_01
MADAGNPKSESFGTSGRAEALTAALQYVPCFRQSP